MTQQKKPSVEEVREAMQENRDRSIAYYSETTDDILAYHVRRFLRHNEEYKNKAPFAYLNEFDAVEYIRREEGREKP